MATTMHCAPKRWEASRTNSGVSTAAVLIDALSAPAFKSRRMSSTVRMPPPTVTGMKQRSAVRATTSRMMGRSSCGRRDVEEAELVGALGVVAGRHLDRVAGVGQVQELDALHYAARLHVEAGDDSAR